MCTLCAVGMKKKSNAVVVASLENEGENKGKSSSEVPEPFIRLLLIIIPDPFQVRKCE